ncbi:hypothetical protein [Brevibacillus brevis]|uniref:hypothetical protein n=1 Tax=Brevibacillus brevis TaxID=1393 RepID=UPI0025A5CEFE|nr:hypothetical protein [Brevibacillus brevis]WJQ79807.1 hypothetical protein QN310_20270 [Brevibacillus brevis]
MEAYTKMEMLELIKAMANSQLLTLIYETDSDEDFDPKTLWSTTGITYLQWLDALCDEGVRRGLLLTEPSKDIRDDSF